MNKEYEIPEDVSEKAKIYMVDLLMDLKNKGREISPRDHMSLDLIADTYDDFLDAKMMLKRDGKVIRETNARNTTLKKLHPAVRLRNDAKVELRKLLNDFGLAPTSRGRVDAAQGNLFEDNPQFERFKIVKKPGEGDTEDKAASNE